VIETRPATLAERSAASAFVRDQLLWVIWIIALTSRIYIAADTNYLWDEERDWIPVADAISFQSGRLNLPLRADYHPVLPAYLIAAGAALPGLGFDAFRVSSVVFGFATVLLCSWFVYRWKGPVAARWAALLLALNEYHVGVSSLAVEKTFYIFFALAAIVLYARFLRTERAAALFGSMACVGFSFLCKETAALLIPAFLLTLLFTGRYRWLARKDLYLALGLFAVVISPDLLANITGRASRPGSVDYGSHLSRIEGIAPRYQPTAFYLYDIVKTALVSVGRPFRDPALEYAPMNSIFGVILLCGVATISVRQGRSVFRRLPDDEVARLLVVVFVIIFVFFSMLKTGWGRARLDPMVWFWVDLTLLPAVMLTGAWIASLTLGLRSIVSVLAAAAVCVAGFRTIDAKLGRPEFSVEACPDAISPADGRFVRVRTATKVCRSCTAASARLVKVAVADVEGRYRDTTPEEAQIIQPDGLPVVDLKAAIPPGEFIEPWLASSLPGRRYRLFFAVAGDFRWPAWQASVKDGVATVTTIVRVTEQPFDVQRPSFWACR
jgi:hypothetical protein